MWKQKYEGVQYTYQRFTAVFLSIYGSLFMSGIYYCLRVFWCAAARMSIDDYQHRCAQRNSEKEKGLEKYTFTTCLHQTNSYNEHIN